MFAALTSEVLVVRNVTLHTYDGARAFVIYDDHAEQPIVEIYDPGSTTEACKTFWYRHVVTEGTGWSLVVDNPHGGGDPFIEFYSSGYRLHA